MLSTFTIDEAAGKCCFTDEIEISTSLEVNEEHPKCSNFLKVRLYSVDAKLPRRFVQRLRYLLP